MNALLSVSDMDGLNDFARGLDSLGVTIYATGGTERALRDAGVPVHALHELAGLTEMLDGRVKTLHPNVHAGILARRDEPGHLQELADRELKLIDLVVVNLYPFVDTVASGAGHAEAIESIDIGGVTLLRAAAKNHDHVLPVVRPSDYPTVLAALKDPAGIPPSLRRHLAAVAFGHTAAYDAAIGEHLRDGQGSAPLPEDFTLGGHKLRDLRYGENPHQSAVEIFKDRPKLRVLQPGPGPSQLALDARPITGGFLVQSADHTGDTLGDARLVTAKAPDDATWNDLRFAWTTVKHVRSNAIVLAHQGATVGVGAGQMSRVEAVELAVHRAGPRAEGAVLASDGFFPYPDGVEVAARAGVRAIVQPGGSVKDSEAIAAAEAAGVAMVFTGERHFKH